MIEKISCDQKVIEEYHGLRFDQASAKLFPQYSRSLLKKWISNGSLTVNKKMKRPRDRIATGDQLIIDAELEITTTIHAENIPLAIIYEDDDLLIINKPANLVVHPAAGHYHGTLMNGLLAYHPALMHLPRAGIVHRLDKDTTGLMMIAKTLTAYCFLVEQLQQRKVKREYQAIVLGTLTFGKKIDEPIGRHPRHRKKMAVIASGKPAVTHYQIYKRFLSYTQLKIQLETGRTHQIRVHMSSFHHPILGDTLYGASKIIPKYAHSSLTQLLSDFDRPALHAEKLALIHPKKKEHMEFLCPLPHDFLQLSNALEQHMMDYTAEEK